MASSLSATAKEFRPPTPTIADELSKMLARITVRPNHEIGTFEGGVLKPRKGVTSQICGLETAWSISSTPPVEQPSSPASEKSEAASAHLSSAGSETAEDHQSTAQPAGATVDDVPQEDETGDEPSDDREYDHPNGDTDPTPPTFHWQYPAPMSGYYQPVPQQHLANQVYPVPAQFFHLPAPQPVNVPASAIPVWEPYRRSWNPAFHGAMSASNERANQLIEEFKVYFGDGRSGNILVQLQKVCYLSGLCGPNALPATNFGCTNLLRGVYVNIFDLVAAGRAYEQGQTLLIPVFHSPQVFADYCAQQGKFAPRWIGRANPLAQWIMDRFL